jgi:hypothetical protein
MSRCETCIHFGTRTPHREVEFGVKQPCCAPVPNWVTTQSSCYMEPLWGARCTSWAPAGTALRDELAQVRIGITRTALVMQALATPSLLMGRGSTTAAWEMQEERLQRLLVREEELVAALTPPKPGSKS